MNEALEGTQASYEVWLWSCQNYFIESILTY